MKTLFGVSAFLTAVIIATGNSQAQVQIQAKKIQIQPKQVQIQPKQGLIAPAAANDNKLLLLTNKGVQQDLKLTAEQIKTVADLDSKFKEAIKNLKAPKAAQVARDMIQQNQVAIEKLLNKDQNTRLGQLEVQQKGPQALLDQQIAKDLNITPEQRTQIQQAIRESAKKRTEIMRDNKGNQEKIQEKLGELNKGVLEGLVKGLTDGQRGFWKTIVGEPYRGTLPAPGAASTIGIIRPGINPLPIKQLPPA